MILNQDIKIIIPFTHVSRDQAAQFLNVSKPTIDRYCTVGKKDRYGVIYKLRKDKGKILSKDLINFHNNIKPF